MESNANPLIFWHFKINHSLKNPNNVHTHMIIYTKIWYAHEHAHIHIYYIVESEILKNTQ